tara:strand:+ start:430 stop:618 length:189 start_codon:yes stop_codon:yes gene_type:complete
MNEDEVNTPKNIFEIGGNLDALSVDELINYISILENEIIRVNNIKLEKSKALEVANNYFKRE